jgi:hypothetical protein
VRGDIAYHETPNGGACFAFSSIAYCGSLPWNNCDNNISRLTKNVLDRFAMDGAVEPLLVEAEILHDEEVGLRMPPGRGRHREGVRAWTSASPGPSRASTTMRSSAISASSAAARRVSNSTFEAFRRHADAGHRMQVAPAKAPHPTEFARALVVVLARIGPPGADAGLMYMGADAWYWVHSFHPGYEDKGRGIVTEMRRCESVLCSGCEPVMMTL